MARKLIWPAPALLFLSITALMPLLARADDFGNVVHSVERHYQAKKKKIPLLGLAGFAVKVVHPAGVKSFKVAVFEDQDFQPGERDRAFEREVAGSLNSKWKPLVRSSNHESGSRTYAYSRESGHDIEMLTVTFSASDAIVAQAKVSPDAMAKFLEKPELLGLSLAGGLNRSPSLYDPSAAAGGMAIRTGGGRDSSLRSLRDPNVSQPDSGDSRSGPPKLMKRSVDDVDFSTENANGTDSPRRDTEESAIHLEARLINLNVKASDRGGALLTGLDREDFTIFEDGIEQKIFYFEPVSAPISLVLLLDLSGSTKDSRNVMIETARRFIDSLGSDDRIALAAFTRDFVVLSDFTSDKKRLKAAVEKVKNIQGGTAFYDGMWATLDLLQRVKSPRKAIVVLTDGVDNSLLRGGYVASKHSFDRLLARVAEEDATIYPIYLNPEETKLRRRLADQTADERQRERIGRRLQPDLIAHRQIDKLAEESAGTVFVADAEKDLDGVYQRVAAELRVVYTLAYAPKNDARDGTYRKLAVKVNREGAVVKTRRGYVAR